MKVSFPKFCELLSQFSLILFHYQVWARFYPFYSVIYPPTELVNAVEFSFFVSICAELSGTERAKIMFVAREIPAEHKDLIHDVSYDYHGRRMATCSSDQSVKVWDLGEDGQWHCTASWKTHSGSVWKVTWAHPEFGQVLASCSFDRTAAVWEEQVVGSGDGISHGQSHWVKRTSLVDSRTSVTDVKFAPKHQGLRLATCSKDGTVRIYDAPDIMNLSQWQLLNEIPHKLSCSCVSWNLSRMHAPMLAVGSNDPNTSAGGKVQIHEYNEASRKWHRVETLMAITDAVNDVAFAPNLGRSYHLLAIASKDVRIMMLKPYGDQGTGAGGNFTKLDISLAAQFSDHESQVWRVEWNVTGTILASSGDDGCVRLWKANYLDNWKCIAVLRGDGTPGPMNGPSMNGKDPKTAMTAGFSAQRNERMWYS